VDCLLFFGCHSPGFWSFPKLSLADFIFFKHSEPQVVSLSIKPVELHFLHSFTSNLPSDMPSTQDTSAIAASLGFVAIAALIIFTMALCLIGEHRSQTREKRGSVTAPVIDICRPAHSNGERDSYMAEPQWPREAYLSAWQPSPGFRVVPRHDDTLRRTGLHDPSGRAISDLTLEAQSWKPTREKRYTKAEPSRPFSVELPISPPPSYSQIDKSLLVSVL